MRWDPVQYERFAGERARPFLDLVARVGAEDPRRVVDLGCGPGTTTALLAERWPDAEVEGLDSSPDMINAARGIAGVSFRVEDIESWLQPADVDVLVANAVLHWVPEHADLLVRWAGALPVGGWLAFQVPGNFDAPSHALLRALALEDHWSEHLAGVLRHEEAVMSPAEYATLLLDAGLEVDVWESTYLHVLDGDDAVLNWVRGTALRPVLDALPPAEAKAFEAEFAERLRVAYPSTGHGTFLPFRRIFAAAHRE